MNQQQKTSWRLSRTRCCVVGCGNSYAKTAMDGTIKFYSFPNKPYEVERERMWIQRVRRCTADGEPWTPSKWDVICSAHFVQNRKSSIASDPSYNPTIFPDVYRTRTINENLVRNRHERHLRRGNLPMNHRHEEAFHSECDQSSLPTVASIGVQVGLPVSANEFVWECEFLNANTKSTFCNILKPFSKEMVDEASGPEEEWQCVGFHGTSSIDVNSDEKWSALTGLNWERFQFICRVIPSNAPNEKISQANKVLLFLMKLKLGVSFTALGVLFGVHRTSAARLFQRLLSEIVTTYDSFVYWPSRELVRGLLPTTFKMNYPKCRIILDCSEIAIEHPHSVDNRIFTYSQYKGGHTAKFLIAINPHGFICFMSKCYGGRATDPYIVNDCGILDLLEIDDLILADKGFPGIRCDNNSILVMPPFVHDGVLTVEEVETTYNIASVRIHVERCIKRIKNFNVLKLITSNLFPHVDDIVKVCAILRNLQEPILKQRATNEQ